MISAASIPFTPADRAELSRLAAEPRHGMCAALSTAEYVHFRLVERQRHHAAKAEFHDRADRQSDAVGHRVASRKFARLARLVDEHGCPAGGAP